MTTVVINSEEEASLSVVRFTSELCSSPELGDQLFAEAEKLIVEGRWLDLTSQMLTSAELLFSKVSDKDLECIFTIICSHVRRSENLDEVLEMAKLISTKVALKPSDKPALRLKILFNLYNLLVNPYSKFCVYMSALTLAIDGEVTEHVIPSFKRIDSFLKEWNIGISDQRQLFLTISNILKENKSSAKDSFYFLTKYLTTFSGEDAHAMSEAKEEAVHAIVEFVKSPDVFQCDLLDMPAVGQLEQDAKYTLVYQLLKIFLTKRLDAYLDFQTANSKLLEDYGIVHEDCLTKMRLLSLADLGSSGSGEIPYSLIKDTLQVTDEEVEQWVVKAISAKVFDCKMDQMNETVIVSRCTERLFGISQWQSLKSKLAIWRGNVANVITTIQANKVAEDATHAAAGLAQNTQTLTIR